MSEPRHHRPSGVRAVAGLLSSGAATSVGLTVDALRRVAALDRGGPRLNAMPVLAADAVDRASESDARRRGGAARGPLDGLPYGVKDSFAVRGMPLAAGSPAFAGLTASRDAVVVERLRRAGSVVLGRTTMPPMAIGGGQAGLYGRCRSPYNPEHLAAAWHSGSSIGSAVAVAAGVGAFGLGEETVSSGRSPASNNALVAYTPSWGVIPSAGNWPLHPFRDVVVPHTLDVADLALVLRSIAGADDRDVWRRQTAVDVSRADAVIADLTADAIGESDLRGLRVGVPGLYLGERMGEVPGIPLRPSIRALWDRAARALADAGATLVIVPFPLVEAYEGRAPGTTDLVGAGYLPADWTAFELGPLMTSAWAQFLTEFGDGSLTLRDIAPTAVRPDVPYSVDAVAGGRLHPGRDVFDYTAILRAEPLPFDEAIAAAGPALTGLVAARERLFEEWLDALGLDVLAFPANSDIGPWDAETNPDSARRAWADGAVFSSTNHVMRRVGLPSATVPMGVTEDLGMPVGLTLCGPAYSDASLLRWAAALERVLPPRVPAPLPEVPGMPETVRAGAAAPSRAAALPAPAVDASATILPDGSVRLRVTASAPSSVVVVEAAGFASEGRSTAALDVVLPRDGRALHGDASVLVLARALDAEGATVSAGVADIPYLHPSPVPTHPHEEHP